MRSTAGQVDRYSLMIVIIQKRVTIFSTFTAIELGTTGETFRVILNLWAILPMTSTG
jgi:hypothetical protein